MSTLNLHLPHLHLGRPAKAHGIPPGVQMVVNFLAEAGQVLRAGLHLIPAPLAQLSPSLRRDMGL